VDGLLDAAQGLDLVGILAAGAIRRGFASSLGQRNWFTSHPFSLDYCLYHQGDKAVKCSYAGFHWRIEELERQLGQARQQLMALARPARRIEPGRYRAYLTPAALQEITTLLAWDGFGARAQQTGDTPLLRLARGEDQLHESVSLRENTADGIAPDFGEEGFIKPHSVPLVEKGRWAGALISPRSAREFGLRTNGASESEFPVSLDMAPGDLPREQALERLGTGIWIGNLWYLNYSDRPACRITGMTRFATFWVQDGRIEAPIEVMRFDDTVYRMLGSQLEALSSERDFMPSPETYFRRSSDSARLPGALLREIVFTL